METFDVGVIGAGIHGASAAYHLAARGVRTVVLERGTPASGPTGRSSAICRAYYTNGFLAEIARDSIDMFMRFEEIIGRSADFRRTGALFLHAEEDREQVLEAVGKLNELDIPTEVLEPAEIHRRFPAFDLGGVGLGAWERDAGYADPSGATYGLIEGACQLGARLRLGAEVTRIEPRAGGGAVLVTSDGGVWGCARVLIAAGPWTGALARQTGVELPLTVERHIVGTFRWAGTRPVPLHADLPGGYYLRPEGKSLFLVGPLHPAYPADPDDYPEGVSDTELADLIRPVMRRLPELEQAEVHGGWAGLYDVSPDWQPVIGEIGPGLFVDAGTSGHGFKLAPALGRHVAALVMGELTDPALHQFGPQRFEQRLGLSAGYGEARILG